MKRDASSPEAYRADVKGELSEILEHVRSLILAGMSEPKEEIQYGMLNYPGIANLAAQKAYVAMYCKPAVLAAWKSGRRGVDCGKSCLRLRRPGAISDAALRELIAALDAYEPPAES